MQILQWGSLSLTAILLPTPPPGTKIIINHETSSSQTESEKSLLGKNKTDVYKLIISSLSGDGISLTYYYIKWFCNDIRHVK